MNYYDAREKKGTDDAVLGWHYTCMNDGRIWAVGYCSEHEPHATKDEAYECWTRYLLTERLRLDGFDSRAQHRCAAPDCDSWTQHHATVDHSMTWSLCDAHRNADVVAALLGTVGAAMSSW